MTQETVQDQGAIADTPVVNDAAKLAADGEDFQLGACTIDRNDPTFGSCDSCQ